MTMPDEPITFEVEETARISITGHFEQGRFYVDKHAVLDIYPHGQREFWRPVHFEDYAEEEAQKEMAARRDQFLERQWEDDRVYGKR